MKRRNVPLITESSQVYTFTRAALVLGAAQGTLGAALIGRMAWISIAENERYQLLSESNRVQMQLLPPRRGWVVDRTASRSRSTGATSASTSSPTA
jgi:penicillin-binding protein 2